MPDVVTVVVQAAEAGAAGSTSESPKKLPQPVAMPASASKRVVKGIATQ